MENENEKSIDYDSTANRLIVICLAISDGIYLLYLIKCMIRLKITKDWRFLFPLIAALFAFCNNVNDLVYFVYAPKYISNLEQATKMCGTTFLTIFKITASLNWTPISWLQVIRLCSFSKRYFTKQCHILTVITTVIFSLTYTVFYYVNLSNFQGVPHLLFGCGVKNEWQYTEFVQISDVADSFFSLSVISLSLYLSMKNVKKFKLRHQKIKTMLDEGMIQLIILTVAKIGIYFLIMLNTTLIGGDIFWDALSVIVIICSYRMVNLRPKLKETTEMNLNKKNKKNELNINKKNNWPENNNNWGDLNFIPPPNPHINPLYQSYNKANQFEKVPPLPVDVNQLPRKSPHLESKQFTKKSPHMESKKYSRKPSLVDTKQYVKKSPHSDAVQFARPSPSPSAFMDTSQYFLPTTPVEAMQYARPSPMMEGNLENLLQYNINLDDDDDINVNNVYNNKYNFNYPMNY